MSDFNWQTWQPSAQRYLRGKYHPDNKHRDKPEFARPTLLRLSFRGNGSVHVLIYGLRYSSGKHAVIDDCRILGQVWTWLNWARENDFFCAIRTDVYGTIRETHYEFLVDDLHWPDWKGESMKPEKRAALEAQIIVVWARECAYDDVANNSERNPNVHASAADFRSPELHQSFKDAYVVAYRAAMLRKLREDGALP